MKEGDLCKICIFPCNEIRLTKISKKKKKNRRQNYLRAESEVRTNVCRKREHLQHRLRPLDFFPLTFFFALFLLVAIFSNLSFAAQQRKRVVKPRGKINRHGSIAFSPIKLPSRNAPFIPRGKNVYGYRWRGSTSDTNCIREITAMVDKEEKI